MIEALNIRAGVLLIKPGKYTAARQVHLPRAVRGMQSEAPTSWPGGRVGRALLLIQSGAKQQRASFAHAPNFRFGPGRRQRLPHGRRHPETIPAACGNAIASLRTAQSV